MKYKQISALLLTRHICLLQFMLPFEELKRTRKCTPIKYAWKCYSIPLARQYASVVPLIFWKRYGIFIHARDFFDGLTAIWRLSKFHAQASFDLAGLLHFRDSSQKKRIKLSQTKMGIIVLLTLILFSFQLHPNYSMDKTVSTHMQNKYSCFIRKLYENEKKRKK